MNEKQIELVQSSWEHVLPIADVAAELFYTRLFVLDPSLKSMFQTDLSQQGTRLMRAISFAVNGLSKPEEIVPVLEHLGRRHVSYGVVTDHYTTVGAAFLWTLEQGLQDHFTDAVREAWTEAYTLMSDTMIKAAEKAILEGAHEAA